MPKSKSKNHNNIQVVFEDNHLIALNKPNGWLVHGDQTGDLTLLDYAKQYIKDRYNKPGDVFLGPLHRIDRPVSGVVLFGRTTKALQRMTKIIQGREIKKTYWALTERRPDIEFGSLTHWIKKDPIKNKALALDQPSNRSKDAKKATLSYSLVAQIGNIPMLEIQPTTGRPHQIRVQLSKVDAPIKYDLKYGAPSHHPDLRIYLHSRSLEFIHPVRKSLVKIVADPPNDQLWNLFSDIWEEL